MENLSWLPSCAHPKPGLAGEMRPSGGDGECMRSLVTNAHTLLVLCRLCDADVHDCSVVGLSQSGCVCVWELGRLGSAQMVWAPEREGWQLARWGEGGTLVTGHHNGDVTLHYSLK